MVVPLFITFSSRGVLFSNWSGHVQWPFPMSGASFEVNLTALIQWLVSIVVGPAFYSKRVGVCLYAVYILSNLKCI